MNTTVAEKQTASIITSAQLLKHWQAHRKLTRRVIEAFPEKEFFEYSIGGMRPFAGMVQELLGIAAPGIRQIVMGEAEELNEHIEGANSKTNVLRFWDKATDEINDYWSRIGDEKFDETILAFGKFESTVRDSILYFIDNEIHHRAQGYVFLRSLGIEPPPFWDR
jgi:uncharacterized damage-inducible protein DinB